MLASTPFRACHKLFVLSPSLAQNSLLYYGYDHSEIDSIWCSPTSRGLTSWDWVFSKHFDPPPSLVSLRVVVKGVYCSNTLFFPLSEIDLRDLLKEDPEGPPLAFSASSLLEQIPPIQYKAFIMMCPWTSSIRPDKVLSIFLDIFYLKVPDCRPFIADLRAAWFV